MNSQELISATSPGQTRLLVAVAGCRQAVLQTLNRDFLQRFPASFLAVSGLLFLDGQLGPITLQLRRVVGLVCILIVAAIVRSRAVNVARTDLIKLLGCCLLSLGILMVPATHGAVFVYACALASLACCCKTQTVVRGVVEASLCYVVFAMIRDFVPELRVVDQYIRSSISDYLLSATGLRFSGSAVSISLPALLIVGLMLLCRWRLFGRFRAVWLLILLSVTWLVSLPFWVPDSSAGTQELFIRSAFFSLAIVALGILPICVSDIGESRASPTRAPYQKVFVTAALIVAGITGVISAGGLVVLEPANPTILVHNRGGLDWERPVFGRFGLFSSGMFGLLPVYARANGFDFNVLDKDDIESEDLKSTQILVLINSPKQWSEGEKTVISDFVNQGGSLLVLGDHTDVFGLMKGFNSLLDDFGIQFNFDSAYYARSGWRGCCTTAFDSVASNWDLKGHSMAIGASLKLSGSARSLLTGRYGHSDIGVPQNRMGSFLGNYKLDEGENIGELPLVAMVTHGRGRVVVWGDTSPFQGSGTTVFPGTVGPLLNLLSRQTQFAERTIARHVAAVLLVLILVITLVYSEVSWLIALLLATVLVAYHGAAMHNTSVLAAPLRIADDCFVVDGCQFPAVGHYDAKVNPIGPLYTCLLRSGLRVAHLKEWDFQRFRKARGIAFVAPQKAISLRQVSELEQFEQDGGIVLVAAGYPDLAGCRALLAAHDVSLAPRPLGTIPPGSERRNKDVPRFLDAYPIVAVDGTSIRENQAVEILYEAGDDITAVFCRKGSGGLLLFADTRFFSSMNVEYMSTYRSGNLAFIHDVFQKYLAVDPELVTPLFRSPEKPK